MAAEFDVKVWAHNVYIAAEQETELLESQCARQSAMRLFGKHARSTFSFIEHAVGATYD